MNKLSEKLFPLVLCRRVWDLGAEELRRKGYRGIILDIDGTLAVQDGPPAPEAQAYILALKQAGIGICLISNNGPERVGSFAAALDCPYLAKAGKPSALAYLKAMGLLGTGSADTLAAGDQLLTDVWGANRAGLCSVLTKSLDRRAEAVSVKLKRPLEALLLLFCRRAKRRELPAAGR